MIGHATADGGAAFPVKSRNIHNHHMDSTVWDDFQFRPDDVVIATYAKSGTTWTQQIVGQLIFGGAPDVKIAELSPWLDLRAPPKAVKLGMLEAQTHRRFVKTHLPVDALVFSPEAKYIYVGRDGRDVVWSLYNHHSKANDLWYQVINETPGRVGPPIGRVDRDVRSYFERWLCEDGQPFWPFWENVRSWWEVRDLPNVLVLHFGDLKRDLPGNIRRIAAFLDIPLDEGTLARIVEHCGFDFMKAHADNAAPLGGAIFDGGGESFIHKGTNGRWMDELPEALSTLYETRAVEELGAECAAWLRDGGAVTRNAPPSA